MIDVENDGPNVDETNTVEMVEPTTDEEDKRVETKTTKAVKKQTASPKRRLPRGAE